MDAATLAREYYDAIDAGDYDRLRGLLAAGFVHERPDRTIGGREAFVRFVREQRPDGDTTHEVEDVYSGPDDRVAVRGRLLRSDGREWFRFVDAFSVDGGVIDRIRTYTRSEI